MLLLSDGGAGDCTREDKTEGGVEEDDNPAGGGCAAGIGETSLVGGGSLGTGKGIGTGAGGGEVGRSRGRRCV